MARTQTATDRAVNVDTEKPNYPLPTAQVQPYVDALGIETAIEFLINFGGAELSISKNPIQSSMLAQAIGLENAKKLHAYSHMMQARVPLATCWLAQCIYAQGRTQAAIARRLRVSDVTIRQYVKKTNSRGFPGFYE